MGYTQTYLSNENRMAIVRGVSCALVLERAGYGFDRRESTAKCLKYRDGISYPINVVHNGAGWWDTGFAKEDKDGAGDVFDLYRKLNPGASWRETCDALAGLVGVTPEGALWAQKRAVTTPVVPPAERWESRKAPWRKGKVWTYLAQERGLPDAIIRRAISTDCLRDGYHAAWFCHRDAHGNVCGAELRGPDTHLHLTGTVKTLFRFKPKVSAVIRRLVVAESAIDALSVAALDPEPSADTLYVSVGGGIGPETEKAIKAHLAEMVTVPGAVLVVATDVDEAGDRYADRLYALAMDADVDSDRLFPPNRLNDFNDALRAQHVTNA
ncbi:DUF3991 and TOPRIM domain-containing protein [Neokomagataea thailandica]|nr:DUF3991 and TOPRIM domain-containing protein [Neokomagataea thailandica]